MIQLGEEILYPITHPIMETSYTVTKTRNCACMVVPYTPSPMDVAPKSSRSVVCQEKMLPLYILFSGLYILSMK